MSKSKAEMIRSQTKESKDSQQKKPSVAAKLIAQGGVGLFNLKNLIIEPEELNRDCLELLNYVVKGEQNEARTMIEANPKLLLIKSQCEDYAGRTIIGTAFQVALGAGDKLMWEMILPFLESLAPGEALKQFNKQFPEGIEDDVPAEALKDYYNAIAFAIIHNEDRGLSAIENFRQEITAQKEIRQGKHFNSQHLIAAYQAYVDNFAMLGNLDNEGNVGNWGNLKLFWQNIIGYVQRQMTTYDAQIHCCSAFLPSGNNSSSFFERSSKLGSVRYDFKEFDFWSSVASVHAAGQDRLGSSALLLLAHEKLCQAQTTALAELKESLEQGVYYQPN